MAARRAGRGKERASSTGLGACAIGLLPLLLIGVARAETAEDLKGFGQTLGSPQQERELDYGTGSPRGGSVLDATNPIDLMNRLRRATALDDATPPRDAVDAAIRDFHGQASQPQPAGSGLKGP